MRTKSCDLEKRKKKEREGEKKHFQNKSAVTFFTSNSANGPPHLIKGEKGSSSTAKARIVLFPRIPRPTSHSLQSFREERFSAALMQCDGKKTRHVIEKQRWPRASLMHTDIILMGKKGMLIDKEQLL